MVVRASIGKHCVPLERYADIVSTYKHINAWEIASPRRYHTPMVYVKARGQLTWVTLIQQHHLFNNITFTIPSVDNVSSHVAAADEHAQAPNMDLRNVARLSATLLGQPESITATSLRGLNNSGNTCYGNAPSVALSRLSLVRGWLSSHARAMKANRDHKSRSCMTCDLARDLQ